MLSYPPRGLRRRPALRSSERREARLLKPLLFTVFALLAPVAAAQTAPLELYTGAAAVADQSTGERGRAMPRALQQVLAKLSGLASFEDRPEVGAALGQASALAVSFYYRNLAIPLPDGTAADQLQLVASFASRPVDELRRQLQLPVWQPERKPLTVWLIVDDELGRRIMPIELEYAFAHLAQVAAERGLPIRRPEPDEEGNYPVDLQLLWGGFTEELTDAGPADALVVAALREGPEWNVRMNLEYGDLRWSWRARGLDLQELLEQGMHETVSEIAANAAIDPADVGSWRQEIVVSGVTNAADYARCLAYLQSVSLVEDIRVLAAAPGRVQFSLGLNALPDHLARTLAKDGQLVPAGAGFEYTLLREAGNPEPPRDAE